MIFIEDPKEVSLDEYESCIQSMVKSLAQVPGVISVYQVGGLSSPGISDIDMVVIFDDDVPYLLDPRQQQSKVGRYLFTHPLLATSRSLFKQSQSYTFFHNFKLLYGEEQTVLDIADDCNILKRQWAFEFLVKMYINMAVQREYGICKVRNLLLTGKALLYDIEFLDAEASELKLFVEEIIAWRERWFDQRPSNRDISQNIDGLWDALTVFLNTHLKKNQLFFPDRAKYLIGKNIELHFAERVSAASHGPKLPWVPTRYARKLISIQNRMNRFDINIPFQTKGVPTQIMSALDYGDCSIKYNQRNLPHFLPLTSSLVISP